MKKRVLIQLYSAIKNDYSIKRLSIGWVEVLIKIEDFVKEPIARTDAEFTDALLLQAIELSSGSLQKVLLNFAKELNFNKEVYNGITNKKGTQRSPFGIGS